MSALAQVLAVVISLVLIVMWVLEAFFHDRPALYPILLISPGDVPAVRMWAVNVGFYNLCFGLVGLVGVALLHVGDPVVGRALVLVLCATQVVLGAVLYVSERRLWRSALGQGIPPLVALVAALG
jgi:putative membrane protein